MDFLSANLVNTTTQLTVGSGTLTSNFLFASDPQRQYVTEGFNNDATTASITISFDATTSVSRIAMLQTNVKAFDIYYNGVTANAFDITTTGSTITSAFSNNSETSMYIRTAAVDCTSVTFDLKSTQSANAEKAIGWLAISNVLLNFEVEGRLPSAKDYKPLVSPKQVKHMLSDGGARVQTLAEKKSASIKFKNIDKTFRDKIKTVYDLHGNFIFDSFGTMTGWTDEFIFECVWPGKFNFFKFSDNAVSAGFTGQIKLDEVSL